MEVLEANFSVQDAVSSVATNGTQLEKVDEEYPNSFYIYLTPFLIMLGILGNLLSVYVFFNSKLRLQSTSQYLSALAFSDTLFLLQLFPPWFSTIELNGLFHQQGFCQVFVYISYVTCCISAWLVIAFTVERFVAVQYPLHRNAVCTVRRSRYVIAGIVVFSLLVNVPVLHFARSGQEDCDIDREYLEHAARFNWVDTVVSFTIPLALIIFLNAWIMIGVWRLQRARSRLIKEEQRASELRPRDRATRQLGRPKSKHRVTRMLLIVSSTFVVCNMPAYTLRIFAYAYNMQHYSELDDTWMTVQLVASILFNINFGINFFLYCLSGQKFRRALQQTVPCCGWIARAGAVIHNATFNRGRPSSITISAISNCTEATSNGMSSSTPNQRRRPSPEHYISRWTFDNSRQKQRRQEPEDGVETIELREVQPLPRPLARTSAATNQGSK